MKILSISKICFTYKLKSFLVLIFINWDAFLSEIDIYGLGIWQINKYFICFADYTALFKNGDITIIL